MVGPTTEFDTVLELCRDQQRRIVLAVLANEKRAVSIPDLETMIARHNHHTPLEEVPDEETERIRVSLHHVHLPKLEDHSLVAYDRDRQVVEPTLEFDGLQPQLSAILDADPDLPAPLAV